MENQKREKRFNKEFKFIFGSSPIYETVKNLYVKDIIKNIKTAENFLVKIKYTKKGELSKNSIPMIKKLDLLNITEEKKNDFNVKISSQHNDKLNVIVLSYQEEILMETQNLKKMFNIFKNLKSKMKKNYRFGCSIRGNHYHKMDIIESNICIFKSYMTNNLETVFQELSQSSRLGEVSERWYMTTSFQLFYENDQGGSEYKKMKIEGLEEYNIYSSTRGDSCGSYILKQFDIKAPKGYLPLSDMKALSPVPVFCDISENVDDVKDFILFKSEHYVRCIKKEKKEIKKRVRKEKEEKVLIYDFESYNKKEGKKLLQTPLLAGFCTNEEDFNYFFGSDCLYQFVKMLKESDYKYIVGYNSGKYDYILLKNELIKQGFFIEEVRTSTNSIMKAILKIGDKIIESVDLLNFTNGTLRNNLKSFNCSISKGEFNYSLISLDMNEELKNELISYCELDVIGTYQLYMKLNEPYLSRGQNLLKLFTASQGSFKLLKTMWKKKGILQERTKRTVDEFCRKAIYGGRCEVYKREYKSEHYEKIRQGLMKYEEVDDFMRALDVNSLYPSAMCKNKYPIGKPIYTTLYKNDKMGIYKCNVIKPKNLKFPILCSKNGGGYNLKDEEGYYTSVDIEQSKKYGYKIEIIEGYYWLESDYIFKEYVEEFFEIKKNSPKNSPMYSNAKLSLNSPYGKTIQRDSNLKYFTCSNEEDIIEMKKGRNPDKFKGEIGDDGIGYFEYHEELEAMTDKKAFIGAFILSYSKIVMCDTLQKVDAYYTDTDSLYVSNKDQNNFEISNELGGFSDDYVGKIIYGVFVAKKLKYIELLLEDGTIKKCYTGKGSNVDDLSKQDFKKMLKGLEITNKKEFQFKRNAKNGEIEYESNIEKVLKMNDGQRIFKGNDSYPIGYEEK